MPNFLKTGFLAATVASVSVAASFATTATAQASPRSALAERFYHIDISLFQRELNVSSRQITAAEQKADAAMTTCLTNDVTQIVESDEATPNPNYDTAMQLIGEEAAMQYEWDALTPVYKPRIAADHKIAGLRHIPADLRRTLAGDLTTFKEAGQLNVCADTQAWSSANLAIASEPAGFRHVTALNNALDRIANRKPIYIFRVPKPQFKHYLALKRRFLKHSQVLGLQTLKATDAWLQKVLAQVETNNGGPLPQARPAFERGARVEVPPVIAG